LVCSDVFPASAFVNRKRFDGSSQTPFGMPYVLICAPAVAKTRRTDRVLFVSFLKERGRSSPDFVVRIDRSFLISAAVFARRDRRWCPGSAGGRPRSGRRPWTPAPRGACLFGRRAIVSYCGSSPVAGVCLLHRRFTPGWGQARGGCPSFLRRAGRHGVVRQAAVGWGHSSGATTPAPSTTSSPPTQATRGTARSRLHLPEGSEPRSGPGAGWGSDTKATRARPLFGWFVGGRAHRRSWGSDNKATRARPRFGWLMPRRG
jgi:hypothetical protein